MNKFFISLFIVFISSALFFQDTISWESHYSEVLNITKGTPCLDDNNNLCIMNHPFVSNKITTVIYYFKNDLLIQISKIAYDDNTFNVLIKSHIMNNYSVVSQADNERRIDIMPKKTNEIMNRYVPILSNLKGDK